MSTKTEPVRLTEDEKKLDTKNYILNPSTKKYIKRDSDVGKQLINGEIVPKSLTSTELLELAVETLQKANPSVITNSFIKNSFKDIISDLPRNFPSVWGGKGKKKQPPGKPKGPSNAYIFFGSEVRESIKAANPGVSNTSKKEDTSITSLIGEKWNKLKNKKKYEDMAKADKERYEVEMKVWESKNPEFARSSTKKSEIVKKKNSYLMYSDEHFQKLKDKNPKMTPKEVTALLRSNWKSVEDSEKKKYKDMANEYNKNLKTDT